ncbi:MAG: TolC family protein [Gallionella sp.]
MTLSAALPLLLQRISRDAKAINVRTLGITVHIKFRYVIILLGMLASACAENPVKELDDSGQPVAESEQASRVNDVSSDIQATDTQATATPDPVKISKAAPATSPKASAVNSLSLPEYSALGMARSKLLASLNKSKTVALPSVEFLEAFDDGISHVKNLTLFDAMALSLEYSYEVAAASAHRDTIGYQATAALGPLLPQVDLRYNRGTESSSPSSVTKAPTFDRLAEDTHKRTDSQIFIRQTLFDLPSYFERQRQNFLLQAAEHNLSNSQERVAYETLISYLRLIQLRLNVVMVEAYEAELKKLLNYMNVRMQGGGASKADMQRVKGRVLHSTAAVIEARGAYESGLIEFKRMTGVVPSSLVIPDKLLPVLPATFGAAMSAAIANNDELQAALRDVESVSQEHNAMRGKYSPRLDLEISSLQTFNAGGIAGSDPQPGSTLYKTQKDKRVMLVFNWNLFSGGADRMQDKALNSKRLEFEYRAKDVQRRLEESIRVNFNALRALNGRIDGVRLEMEANDGVLAAFKEQLFSANRSLLDVLDAYQRQYNSRTELTRLMLAESTAGLQMLRNMGKLQEGIVALR